MLSLAALPRATPWSPAAPTSRCGSGAWTGSRSAPAAAWDEKARHAPGPHLATVRAAPGTKTVAGMNVDTLVQDLRIADSEACGARRAARLDELAAQPEASLRLG